MDIYSRYAPFIQDFIYRNRWENLRAVQQAAGEAIFETDENVLLAASTASGKTEAAFFPVLTLISEEAPSSVGVLYIAPLKALINDQFERLEVLCDEAGIPVWHWHGDVSSDTKRKMLKDPSGILQITPESLEAMLMRKHARIPEIFGDLKFIVIDEIHSFLRSDRGGQMLCLLERLSRIAGVNPRRIGLSATIGDIRAVGEYLSAGTGRGTVIPRIKAPGADWRINMEHFYLTAPQASEDKEPEKEIDDELTDAAPEASDPGLGYIFEHTEGKKCLVFSNSREECEAVTHELRQYCEAKNEPDRFLIHHGNLSTAYRLSAEDIIKEEGSMVTVCTTSTLELGIDIGRLERAFQIDAPFTVSSFLQRMGRTGRRGTPSEMWFVMREEHAEQRALLPACIPWKLIQGIALVQVYLEERWVEPPRKDLYPYSLLYHQTMSELFSGGELTPAVLAGRILNLSYFKNISADDLKCLLHHLLDNSQIEQTERGGLIIGLEGERIVNNFRFYAVFQDNEEYSVRCGSEELGTLCAPPPAGEMIAIAGNVWVVEEVDHKRHQVYCNPVKGNVPAYFGDVPGDINTKILKRMKQVLEENDIYPYLLKNASARLKQARVLAGHSALTSKPLINLGDRMYCLFPWIGSYAFLALERLIKIKCKDILGIKGFISQRPYYMQFTMNATEEEFYETITNEAEKLDDPMDLVFPGEVPVFNKYDTMLPEELVKKGFAYGVLDTAGMKECVKSF
ncbi:MAG: DEAD/DEAH box helicase [Lachnospiraceae bacterium]|nr:DEAD/DEAH box helicase [Lachnospiraceae bacterium]